MNRDGQGSVGMVERRGRVKEKRGTLQKLNPCCYNGKFLLIATLFTGSISVALLWPIQESTGKWKIQPPAGLKYDITPENPF